VGSLRALAFGAWQQVRSDDPLRVMAAIDARMGQLYWAVYEHHGVDARELAAAALAVPEQMAGLVAHWQPQVIVGNALRTFEAAWPSQHQATRLPDLAADASMTAELARIDLAAGRTVAARDAAPEYVRDQVALTVAQRSADAGSAP